LKPFIFIALLLPSIVLASNENDPAGARAAGMGNAALGFKDIWSFYQNQAGLAHLDAFTAGVFYENRFLVKGMSYQGFAAANPLGENGVVSVGYSGFGFSVYKEDKVGAAYSMRLAKNLTAGVGINYHSTRITAENYGSTGLVTAELGVQMQVSKNVMVSSHIFNPFRAQLNDFNDERLPTILRLGASYQISDDLLAALEVEKDIDQKPSLRGGIEYQPVDILYIRLGSSTLPNQFSFGLGVAFKQFRFDLAGSYHSQLGYTPQVSLTYLPQKQ
jgi:hypothetical protein